MSMLSGLINTNQMTILELEAIRLDGGTQPREGLDEEYIGELVESLQEGATLPAVDVMYDGTVYWLYDGFHRLAATRKAGRPSIAVTVHQGDLAAAQWQSYAANQSHGKRRSPSDKERAIRAALKHPNGAKMSDSLIAKHLGVSNKTVTRYREKMESAWEIPKLTERQGADGKVYNTTNIGTNQPVRKTPVRYDSGLPALTMPSTPGTYQTPFGAQAKMPIEDWELEDFVEQVATEYYGKITAMVGDSMTLASQEQAGEYWAKLLRVLTPFDVTPERIGAAVAATVERLVGERRGLRPGSPEAKQLGKEIKAATWGDPAPGAKKGREGEGEKPKFDEWTLAWAGGPRGTVNEAERRLNALATAMEPWVLAWTDDKGRTWRDVVDRNPQHANSPFRQDLSKECKRRGFWVADSVLAKAITQVFSNLAKREAAEPAGKPLIDWTDEDWAAYAQRGAPAEVSMPDHLVDTWAPRIDAKGVYLVDVVRNRTTETVALDEIDELFAQAERMDAALDLVVDGGPLPGWVQGEPDAADEERLPHVVPAQLVANGWMLVAIGDGTYLMHNADGRETDSAEHIDECIAQAQQMDENRLLYGEPQYDADVEVLRPAPVSQREGYDSDEWYTPGWVIEAARQVMGEIDLDPASCELAQETVQAGLFWAKRQDGCRMSWFGRVWLNPPYSAPGAFVEKLIEEYAHGNVKQACVLLNNATETKWFQRLLARFPVCFFGARLAFWRHDHEDVGARQGQALFYLGPDVERFCEVFGEHGIVVKRLD